MHELDKARSAAELVLENLSTTPAEPAQQKGVAMRYRSALVACVAVIGLVAAAIPVAAQATGEPITWVWHVTAKPGKWMDLEKVAEKYDKPVFDKLVADSAIIGWGLAYQQAGPPDQSYIYWVTGSDWAAMGKVEKAFEDNYKAMKEADRKAAMDAFLGATQPEKESTSVLRHVVFKGTPGTKPVYLMRHAFKVKPGKGQAAMKMYKEYDVPVYDKLLEAGVITAYGVVVPEIHTGSGWTHLMWYMFTDMSQFDAMEKAWKEDEKTRSDSMNETLMSSWMQLHDMDAHWDSLMKISLYGGLPK